MASTPNNPASIHGLYEHPQSHLPAIDEQSEYLQEIKATFKDDQERYTHFLGMLNDVKTEKTELLDIICNVSELFLEHPALIQGFNRLLPQGYYIHYAPGDFNHHFVSVTLPSGDTIQIIGNPPRHDISAQPKPAPCTSSLSPESSRGRSLPPVFPGSGTKPSSRMHGSGARGPGLGAGRIETENDWSEPVVLGDASAGVRSCAACRRYKFLCIVPREGSACQRCSDRHRRCVFDNRSPRKKQPRKRPLRELRDMENTSNAPGYLASSSRPGSILGSTVSRPLRQSARLSTFKDNLQIPRAPASLSTRDSARSRHTPATPKISGAMAASDVVSCLVQHGCQDITDLVDFSTCTQHPISTGGFGDIYQAKLKNGHIIAIKCMRILIDPAGGQKHLKCAAREIYTWSKCEHRHVLKLLGLVQFRGQIGMVSPWVARGSLGNYIAQNPSANRLQLCGQVADGLAYLHQCGIVHGDLKGANVLVSDDGDALLTDFGNAVLQERTLQFTYSTAKNHLSPRWTAPELIRGEGSFSVYADIFALGMTMLEIITGSVPYYQLNDFGVMYAIVEGRLPDRPGNSVPINSQWGDFLWVWLARCWNRVAELRPSAYQVKDTMTSIMSETYDR